MHTLSHTHAHTHTHCCTHSHTMSLLLIQDSPFIMVLVCVWSTPLSEFFGGINVYELE